jgi:hypothetical protein
MRVLCSIVLGVLFAVPVSAQPDRAEPAPTVYEFEPASVPGERTGPRVETISVRRPGDRHSLVRPRAQLVDRLRESIESL